MESLSVHQPFFGKCHAGLAMESWTLVPATAMRLDCLIPYRKMRGCDKASITNMVDVPRRTDAGIPKNRCSDCSIVVDNLNNVCAEGLMPPVGVSIPIYINYTESQLVVGLHSFLCWVSLERWMVPTFGDGWFHCCTDKNHSRLYLNGTS